MTAVRTEVVAVPHWRVARTCVDGHGVTGRPCRVWIERWSTSVLGCDIWRTLTERTVVWHRTLDVAIGVAVREFTVAAHGHAPVSPQMLATTALRGVGWVVADRIAMPEGLVGVPDGR